eukprot:CAMPEP_0181470130 /NCGR_PEP_ID=MMETSP1110-20121109/38390_1 /TAXON_ID=174948 /ORGANISM="Symbiodinium sp., Strain CCMP421" /LENGTH=44 /DNA_ID= /DNA_START= /DNA_END= /DNA_ORIENTATION=
MAPVRAQFSIGAFQKKAPSWDHVIWRPSPPLRRGIEEAWGWNLA